MKRSFMAAAAAAAVIVSSSAFAQTSTTVTTGSAPAASITIAPEQRTKIKTYVTEHKVKPIAVKEKVVVGSTLPADVELLAVPADWGPSFASYRYVYADNRVVLVEPSSRKIVQVIE